MYSSLKAFNAATDWQWILLKRSPVYIYSVNVGEGCVGVLQCSTITRYLVYVCVSLSVCVFKCTYVRVCVCLFGCACVYTCMCLRSSAKALKPTKMFCCAVQHTATHPLYAGQRELSSTHHRECSQCFCTGESICCGTFTMPTKSNLKMTHLHLMYLV